MKTTEKAQQNKQEPEEVSKIDAIKDLLFGENIQTYDKEFQQIKKDIANKKNELLEIVEDTRKELYTAIDNLSTDVNIRITSLEENLDTKLQDIDDKKLDKTLLGELLIKLGQNISG